MAATGVRDPSIPSLSTAVSVEGGWGVLGNSSCTPTRAICYSTHGRHAHAHARMCAYRVGKGFSAGT